MGKTDITIRVTKEIKEFIKLESQNKGISQSKVVQLHFAEKLPFIKTDHIKIKKK